MASRFRFDPPQLDVSSELAWVISRAFAPAGEGQGPGDRLDTKRAIELANTLDLTARIGARTPPMELVEELGDVGADQVVAAHRQTAAHSLVVEQLCRELAEVCRELETPTVFLKGAALLLAGRLPTGARRMTDIDLLTLGHDAPQLQRRMKEAGWRERPGPSGEHQLQVLTHRSGLGLEVHTMILGVRVAGSGSVSADEILANDLAVPLPAPFAGSSVPVDTVLLAHLLVHGIAQHGLYPQSYPMSRLITDAQDLCGDREHWDDLLPAAMGWIQSDVSLEEAEAVRDLALRLGGGEDPAEVVGASDRPSLLLRHILAGALDGHYRDGLRLRSLARPLAAENASWTLFRNAFRTVWLTRPQIDILYGAPESLLGYWGWRVWRPFDLVLRAVRYGRAWIGHRLRKR